MSSTPGCFSTHRCSLKSCAVVQQHRLIRRVYDDDNLRKTNGNERKKKKKKNRLIVIKSRSALEPTFEITKDLRTLTAADVYETCVNRVHRECSRRREKSTTNTKQQLLIGIAGPPGGGKSTLTKQIKKLWTKKNYERELSCAMKIVQMDGYHYRKSELENFKDRDLAFAKRGAPFTFDAERFVNDLIELKKTGCGSFPSFDHGVGDPIENSVLIDKDRDGIILIEGNYLLINEHPWVRLVNESVFDETWYIDCSVEEATRRVIERHVKTGKTREIAEHRGYTNDMVNAKLIDQNKRFADVLLPNPQRWSRKKAVVRATSSAAGTNNDVFFSSDSDSSSDDGSSDASSSSSSLSD